MDSINTTIYQQLYTVTMEMTRAVVIHRCINESRHVSYNAILDILYRNRDTYTRHANIFSKVEALENVKSTHL